MMKIVGEPRRIAPISAKMLGRTMRKIPSCKVSRGFSRISVQNGSKLRHCLKNLGILL